MAGRVSEQTTATRYAYVQQNFITGGIKLADLRDLVAATADYDDFSHVTLEKDKVSVREVKQSPWRKRGRDE